MAIKEAIVVAAVAASVLAAAAAAAALEVAVASAVVAVFTARCCGCDCADCAAAGVTRWCNSSCTASFVRSV
jgi:hypothetical protein